MSYHGNVQLPDRVRRSIEERASSLSFGALKMASAAMSDAYREGRPVRLPDTERVAVYLLTRMPATYAAIYSVLREVSTRLAVADARDSRSEPRPSGSGFFPGAGITGVL